MERITIIFAICAVALAAIAANVPPTDPTAALINSEAAFQSSKGFCGTTTAGVDLEVFAAANVADPVAFDKVFFSTVRYVRVTNTSVPNVLPAADLRFDVGMKNAAPTFDPVWPRATWQSQVRLPESCSTNCGNPAVAWPTGPVDVIIRDAGSAVTFCVGFYQ